MKKNHDDGKTAYGREKSGQKERVYDPVLSGLVREEI